MTNKGQIIARHLTVGYENFDLLKNVDFEINEHDIFVIMGGSGCGKSTLLRVLTGLKEPKEGEILIDDKNFTKSSPTEKEKLMRRFGILYQGGALFSSMTLAENIALPLQQYSDYGAAEIADLVSFKLSLVGLSGYEDYYPSEISGGMKKRAGLARALALDPEIVYFDEPSAGLDPISSRLLDDLILDLNQSLGTTIVLVTHELNSIFAIGNNSIFLDPKTQSIMARGDPKDLLKNPPTEQVRLFLTRGETKHG